MKIGKDKFVELSYTLIVDGEVADQSMPGQPLGFVFGAGYLLPDFEKNIDGLGKGDKFEFTITPENGYGLSNPQMIVDLPKDSFRINGEIEEGLLELGNEVPMMTADGMHIMGRVVAVDDEKVKMDFNHPMADKTLNFSGEIVEVRDAKPEDYPQAGGGCSCGCEGDDCGGCEGGECH